MAKVSSNNTLTARQEIMFAVKPGTYRHYKGKLYTVFGVGHHTESLEPLVLYQAQYNTQDFGDNPLWARPVSMFFETIIFDGKEQPRFILVEEK